ncbi:MAG: c-type cytochrome [Burkholderiales bacterium]
MRPFIVLAFACTALAAQAAGLSNPLSPDEATVAAGKKLFHRTGCIACHGNNARGAVGPDLTDDEWLRQPTDEMIFNTIQNGRSGTVMSGFGPDITDEQIWQIITWLRDENRKRKETK